MEIKQGDILEHKLSKDWVLVLDLVEGDVLCRAKNLEVYYFKPFELRTIEPKSK